MNPSPIRHSPQFIRAFLRCAAALLLFAASTAQAQRIFYHGVSLFDHTGVTLHVNGFPLHAVAATQQPLITTDLTAYLVQGANKLTWRFTGQPPDDAASGIFRFRLERKTEGADTVQEQFTIERFINRDGNGAAPDVALFFTERLLVKPFAGFQHELRAQLEPGKASRTRIDLTTQESSIAPLLAEPSEADLSLALADMPLLTLPWQGIPVVLTPADVTEIKAIITALRNAFVAQDTVALTALQTLRIQRIAAARAQTEAAFRAEIIDSYTPLFGTPAFIFDPVDPAVLTLVSHLGVNLVQVLVNGQPPIRATGQANGQNATFKVPVFVSKIAGTWQIVD